MENLKIHQLQFVEIMFMLSGKIITLLIMSYGMRDMSKNRKFAYVTDWKSWQLNFPWLELKEGDYF